MRGAYFSKESFAGRAFTVVFIIAIGFDDRLWGKRYHLAHIGMKHDSLQDLMRVAQLAFDALVGQTTRAIDFFRGKVLRAVKRDQVMTAIQFV